MFVIVGLINIACGDNTSDEEYCAESSQSKCDSFTEIKSGIFSGILTQEFSVINDQFAFNELWSRHTSNITDFENYPRLTIFIKTVGS